GRHNKKRRHPFQTPSKRELAARGAASFVSLPIIIIWMFHLFSGGDVDAAFYNKFLLNSMIQAVGGV
ncbi:hypothetical protein, partial [uncultured Parabacteroides sp.]